MGGCAVFDCKNDSEKKLTHNTSFHLFPKDPKLRKQWITFCKSNIVRASRICSLHFQEEDFENNIRYQMGFASIRKLLKTAVPTVCSKLNRFDFQSGQISLPSMCSIPDRNEHTNSASNDMLASNENSSETACDESFSLKEESIDHEIEHNNYPIKPSNYEIPKSTKDRLTMITSNEGLHMKEEIKEESMEYTNSMEPSSFDENEYTQCRNMDEENFNEKVRSISAPRNDKTNPYFTSSVWKSTKNIQKKNSRRPTSRRVLHAWIDATETSRLIAAVKKRRELWDLRSPQYKLPKNDAWQEAADEVGNVSADDAKIKWMNLRVTFRLNWMKIKNRKPGRKPVIVKWRHYNEMAFLESNEILRSSESASSAVLKNDTSLRPFLEEISQSSTPSEHSTADKFQIDEPVQPTSTPACSSPSPSLRSIGSVSKKDVAAQVSFDYNSRERRADEHSIFGEYIASELRLIHSGASDLLRDKIVRLLIDFKASLRSAATPSHNFPNIRPSGPANQHQ